MPHGTGGVTRRQDFLLSGEAEPADDRVVLIVGTADDARIIRDYLSEVPWLEVCTEVDKDAA